MKTEQIMERNLNGVVVRQSTKTSYFNANDLLAIYMSANPEKPKYVADYFANKTTQDYISAIQADILNTQNSHIIKSPVIEPFHSKRGRNGGTWMHPYLFIDFAMWLSPEFKLTCVKWIYDKLIDLRIEGGDTFKHVNMALFDKKPNMAPHEYSNEAKMINKLVFNDPSGGQRNGASEKQLELLTKLQKLDVHYINQGLDYFERFKALSKAKDMFLLVQ